MTRGMLFIALAALVWGTAPILEKLAFREAMDPLVALGIRASGVFITLAVLLLATGRAAEILHVSPRGIVLHVTAGILAAVVGMWLYFGAMQQLPAGVVVALTSTYPALTLLLSALVLREKLNMRQWGAVGLIVAGVVLLEWSTPPSPPSPQQSGER